MSAIPEDFIKKTAQLSEDVTRPFPGSTKIYVTGSATTTSPLTSTTTADGFMQTGFAAAAAVSAVDGFAYPVVGGALGPQIWGAAPTWINGGIYSPSQHGVNNQERLRRVIAHDVDLVHSNVRDTRTERVHGYSWEIKSGGRTNDRDQDRQNKEKRQKSSAEDDSVQLNIPMTT